MSTFHGGGSGHRIRIGILLSALLILAAAAVAFAVAVRNRQITRESLLHLIPSYQGGRTISQAEVEVQEDFRIIKGMILDNYLGTDESLPESLPDLWTPDNRVEFLKQGHGLINPRLLSGIDPWGSPYIYKLQRRGKGKSEGVVTIRSAGPNRRDEIGAGDDIEKEVWVP